MGLVDGTAIVTPAEVEEITGEKDLSNLNGTNATITNACKWATTWLIDELDSRGIPCEKIANPERLKRAAAYVAAAHALRGSGLDDEADKRAGDYLAAAADLLSKYRFVSSESPGRATSNLVLPELGNQDPFARFGPVNPLRPGFDG